MNMATTDTDWYFALKDIKVILFSLSSDCVVSSLALFMAMVVAFTLVS